jgi:hypothetical protein
MFCCFKFRLGNPIDGSNSRLSSSCRWWRWWFNLVEEVVLEDYRTTFPSPGCNAGSFPVTIQGYPISVGSGGAGGAVGAPSCGSPGVHQDQVQYFQQSHQQVEVLEVEDNVQDQKWFSRWFRWRWSNEVVVTGGAGNTHQ